VKLTVLIIDDSRLQRSVHERALAKAGYAVIGANDGEQGLRLARENLPDSILLDMLLLKLSGPELLRALKRDPCTARIPSNRAEQPASRKRDETERGRRRSLPGEKQFGA